MTTTRLWIALCSIVVLGLMLAACASDSKEAVVEETWDCMAESDPVFEESMMMMFPTAQDIDDAKKQYIYVSQAAPLEELKEARDWACGSSPQSLATATPAVPARAADGAGTAETPGLETPSATEQAAKESGSSASGGDGCDGNQIKVGQTVTGRIGRAGGWNTYCIRVEPGLIYLFDASWDDGGSPFVQVSPGGLIGDDEYIQGFDGYAFIPPTSGSDHSPSGIYKVQVAGGPGYSTITGSYSLTLLSATDDHSNDGETATDVSWGQTIHGSHEYRTDIDVFRLQVEDGHAYQMGIRSEAHSGAVLQLSVNEAALTVNLQEKLVWSSSQSEVLYLSTRTLKTGTGPYSLTLTEFQDDHADQLGEASATTVSLGQTLEGKIDHPADRDMFRIVNEAEDRCRIEVQPGSLPDAFIRHYPPHQQSPAFYARSAGGGLVVLECRGDYVAVSGTGGTGSYSLTLSPSGCPEASRQVAVYRVNVGETVGDTLYRHTKLLPRFCFWAEEGATYQVEASPLNQSYANLTFVTVLLTDTMVDYMMETVAEGEGTGASTLEWTAPAAGMYYFQVGIYDDDGAKAQAAILVRLSLSS